VVPATAQGVQPLHAVYQRSSIPVLRAALASGGYRLRDTLGALRIREVGADEWSRADPTGRFAVNVNRPADLDRGGRRPGGNPAYSPAEFGFRKEGHEDG